MPDQSASSSTSWIAHSLIGIGLLLVVAGIAWPMVLPREAVWSDEQAAALVEAHDAAHAATVTSPQHRGHRHNEPAADTPEGQHYYALTAELDRAREFRDQGGRYVTGSGAVLAGIGLLLYRRQQATN